MSDTKHICLWSGPRNISTALMYSFAQRSDTKVVDEPLYGHYLSKTSAKSYHPMAQEVLNSMAHNGNEIMQALLDDKSRPVQFQKQMTHHLVDIDLGFLKDTINIILTRDPFEMLPSFAKEIETPKMEDVGYTKHIELLKHLNDLGQSPIVLDSKQVLLHPEKTLTKLCKAIGIEFDSAMLHWEKGPIPEDGIWAKHWYGNVHNSTGFKPYENKVKEFPKKLEPLLEECTPMYNQLKALSI